MSLEIFMHLLKINHLSSLTPICTFTINLTTPFIPQNYYRLNLLKLASLATLQIQLYQLIKKVYKIKQLNIITIFTVSDHPLVTSAAN